MLLLPLLGPGQPGTAWFALNHQLLPFRCIVVVSPELAVLRVSVSCRRCPLSSFSHGFISLVVCVGCQARSFPAHTCATCQLQTQLINCISCCSCLLAGDVLSSPRSHLPPPEGLILRWWSLCINYSYLLKTNLEITLSLALHSSTQ